MGSDPGIIDISSDEDDIAIDNLDDASYSWIAEMLDDTDGKTEDFDDVMVVDEFSTALRKQCISPFKRKRGASGDNSDDDCLILDDDPDKLCTVVDSKSGGGDGSDDLLIVGEKGQLACRDYPHPRHLCASFPFRTTPHEKHCDMCHCYVCDSPAPCIYWSKDFSSTDHCHSTDKEGKWAALRKSFKQRSSEAPQLLKPPGNNMITPIHNPSSTIHQSSLPTVSPTLRPCPTSNLAIRNPIIQGHQQRPGVINYRCPTLNQNPSRSKPFNPRTLHPTRSQLPTISHPLNPGQKHPIGSQPFNPGAQLPNRSRPFNLGAQHSSRSRPIISAAQTKKRGSGALAADIMQAHTKISRLGTNVPTSNRASHSHNQVYRAPPPMPQEPPAAVVEETMKKWQDILHGVDAGLGVNIGINLNSATTVESLAQSGLPRTNLEPLDFNYCSWLSNNAPGNPEPVAPSFSGVVSASAETHQNPYPELMKELGLTELDSANLLNDFNSSWNSVAQI